jgi:hypothetical protein
MFNSRARIGELDQYNLGLGSIFTILSLPPAIFLALGYQSNPQLSTQAIIVLIIGLVSVGARSRLAVLFPVIFRPRITNPYAQALVMAFTYIALNLSSRLIVAGQLSSISSYGSTNEVAILFQVSVNETLLAQFFIFFLFFAPLFYATRNYWTSGIVASLISGLWGYFFHYYVYSQTAPLWNWVMVAFTILSLSYWLTGNILVPMIPHVLVDTLGLTLMLLFPGICPLGGLC